jgi:cytochrome c oxidase subunit 3
MGTTVTTTERVGQPETGIGRPPPGRNGPNGNGSGGNGGKGHDGDERRFSPKTYRVTLWILIAAIVMMFAALTVAYIMLSEGESWRPVTIPRLLWLSTGLIIASSWTFESAVRSLKREDDRAYGRRLMLTLALGLGFLVSQLLAWRQLVKQGLYVTSNNHSAFFYLLTGAHGLHLLGGILALVYLILRTRQRRNDADAEMRRQAAAKVVSIYWHFMDGLWVFLFLLLLLWK